MPGAGTLWWRHARGPLVAFAALVLVFAVTQADVAIARLFFVRDGWLGAHSWWVNEFTHTGGRWAVRVLVLFALCIVLASFLEPSARHLRRPAAYFVLSVVLSVGLVGLLKTVTNVDCPWDLEGFGGRFPLVHLLADRPDHLRRAQCFPAAHAGSGYAMLALYFVWLERGVVPARAGLCIGLAAGLVFGICQQSRGAHFASHDLLSAAIAWLVALSVYAFVFKARLWHANPDPRPVRGRYPFSHDAVASRHVAVERTPVLRTRAR